MAKVINPLFSMEARGKMGGLIYETGKFGAYVKGDTPQRGKPTEEQIKMNYAFGATADAWRQEQPEVVEEYNLRSLKMKMTGFNLYIKENFHDHIPE